MDDRRFTNQPLYLQLRQALTLRISTGVWKPGDALPNESEIAREYGLSPGTVRKALDWMEQANLIVRQQGRGTFVCDPASDNLALRYENICSVDGRPVRGEPRLLSFGTGEASADEQRRLRLRSGDQVHRIRQLRMAEGRPLLVKTAVVPAALFPDITEGAYSLPTAARASGVLLGRAEEGVTVASASAPMDAELGVPEGTPLLKLDRIVFAIDGRAVEWRVAYSNLGTHFYISKSGPSD